MRKQASWDELMQQASMTADAYLRVAKQRIDAAFGRGYAAKHPDLVAAFMATAARDFQTAAIARLATEAFERFEPLLAER